MDIPEVSMALSQQRLMTQTGAAVLAKELDTMEECGASMIQMMEQSVNPNLGQHVDISL